MRPSMFVYEHNFIVQIFDKNAQNSIKKLMECIEQHLINKNLPQLNLNLI